MKPLLTSSIPSATCSHNTTPTPAAASTSRSSTTPASTGSQANYRNLHFGIDNAQAGEWTDDGRPGKSIFNHSMAVHNGELYVGTVEGQTNADQGHVYRLDNGKWTDLGAPSKSNGVTAMASYNGHLYVGVSRVLLHYSGLEPTISHHIGGKVFRYEDGQWVDCGQLPGLDGVNGMVVFGGRLYVSGFYQPGLFRYEGGQGWDGARLTRRDASRGLVRLQRSDLRHRL